MTPRQSSERFDRHRAREAAQNALQAFLSAQAAVEADKDGVRAATQALEGVREEAKIGTRTTLDVLNAEQELLDAKTDQAKAQHDRDLAVLQIQAATGTLTADNLKLAVDRYDPTRHYDDVRNQWIGFSEDDRRYLIVPPHAAAELEAPAPSSEPSLKMTSEEVVPQKDIPPAVQAAAVLPVTHAPLVAAASAKPYNFNQKIADETLPPEIATTQTQPMKEAVPDEVAHGAATTRAEPVQVSGHTAVLYNFNKKPQQEQTPGDAASRQDRPPVETPL